MEAQCLGTHIRMRAVCQGMYVIIILKRESFHLLLARFFFHPFIVYNSHDVFNWGKQKKSTIINHNCKATTVHSWMGARQCYRQFVRLRKNVGHFVYEGRSLPAFVVSFNSILYWGFPDLMKNLLSEGRSYVVYTHTHIHTHTHTGW